MNSQILIKVSNLKKSFKTNSGRMLRFFGNNPQVYAAIDNISFELRKGEILGLIGESGCGKSTTARLLLKLIDADEGEIFYKGKSIYKLNSKEFISYRKSTQIIFQDPYEYLNPRMNILQIISEPIMINKMVKNEKEKIDRVSKYLEEIDLRPASDFLYRFTHELSGGQRQRVAIARALITNPDFVVADEPTSMLDVSVRAGILNLLLKLKKEHDLTMIFITHDINTAGYMCDRIAVMYKGRIVEIGSKNEIIFNPKHPYTKALVSVAINLKDFLLNKDNLIKEGEVNNYIQSRSCSFIHRCVMCSGECENVDNHIHEMKKVGEEHYVACCKVY